MISEPLPKVNKKSLKNLRLIEVPTVQESKSRELFYIYPDNRPNNHNEKNPYTFYQCIRFGGAFFCSEKSYQCIP